MVAKKKAAAKVTPATSSTGAKLDPVDGKPVFAEIDGVPHSRVRWLAATAPARKAKVVADLKEFIAAESEATEAD